MKPEFIVFPVEPVSVAGAVCLVESPKQSAPRRPVCLDHTGGRLRYIDTGCRSIRLPSRARRESQRAGLHGGPLPADGTVHRARFTMACLLVDRVDAACRCLLAAVPTTRSRSQEMTDSLFSWSDR